MKTTEFPLELMQGIYQLLGDLRRDSAQFRDLYSQMLKTLRDTHSELEHIRNEHQRIDRLERTLCSEVEENKSTIAKLVMAIAELQKVTGKHPRLNADGSVVKADGA